MSIATVAEVNWNGTIDNDNKIGISDTLDNLPVDVWADDTVFVTAYNNPWIKYYRKTTGYPSVAGKTDYAPWYLSGRTGYSNVSNNFDGDLYLRSALLAVPNDYDYSNWNTGLGGMLRNTDNKIRIITSLSLLKNNITVSITKVGDACRSPVYFVNESVENTTASGTFTYDGTLYKIVCADIYADEDDYFVNIPTALPFNLYDTANGDGIMGSWAYNAITNKMLSLSPQFFEEDDKIISIAGTGYYNVNTWQYHELPTSDANYAFFAYYSGGWHLDSYGNEYYHLINVSRFGMFFEYNSTDYKPVISQGVVTGFTADLDTPSDIDNWTDISGHNISPTPPPPVPPDPDEDNDDPLSSVGAPFGTGLAHFYISTVDGAALTQISEAMSTWDIDATKKDLYRNLISCKIVKPPTAVPATPGVFEIYGVKPQYNGADITINEVTGNPDISFGPYSIDRKFNDFRDRAPYSRAEIFLPYCGWCALPSHVIGRSVSVAYYSDIIAGTVKAVVFCGTNPVAEASGVMSVDIPFAAQNVGEKVAAANIGMLAYGRAAIQTAAGIGTAVASKGKSGWGNILSGGTALIGAYNQLSQVENGNYTEICGKSGDGCALAGVDTIVIKITRPLYGGYTEAPYVPAGFAHTVGFVSMKQSKVNACTGLIVCDNVEVSGISGATDAERAEIKRVLEAGLYVNSLPE